MKETIGNMETPDRKVQVGAINGAIMAIIAWIVGEFTSVQIPPEIAVAGSTIIGFVLAYFVPNK